MRSLWLTFALALAASAGPAMAAPLTVNYAYSVGPFLPGIAGTGVPIDPWTGTLDVTFDPAVAGAGTSAAMQSNAALPGPWDYVSWFADGHLNLELGNDCSLGDRSCIDQTADGFMPNTAFFILDLGPAASPTLSSPALIAAEYTSAGATPTYFHASAGAITPVPEPAALVLMALPMAAIGAIRYRTRRARAQ